MHFTSRTCLQFCILLFLLFLFGCSANVNVAKCEISVFQENTEIFNKKSTYYFGEVLINDMKSVTFIVKNTGTEDLHLVNDPCIETINDESFYVDTQNTKRDLAPGDQTSFNIIFHCLNDGLINSTIKIHSDDFDENPFIFTVKAKSILIAPEISIEFNNQDIQNDIGIADLGPVILDQPSQSFEFNILNTGNRDLLIVENPAKIKIEGNDSSMFEVLYNQMKTKIPPGLKTTFSVVFTPESIGVKKIRLIIENNDSDENPFSFEIMAEGIESPEIVVKQDDDEIFNLTSIYYLGKTLINDDSNKVIFTILNKGTGKLILNGTTLINVSGTDSAMFSVDTSNTNTTIDPQGTTTFGIIFSPTSEGLKSAKLSIPNNDEDEDPFTFNVTGICIVPEINIKTGSMNIPCSTGVYDFGDCVAGNISTEITFKIENLSSGNLKLTGNPVIQCTGTDSAMFTINHSSTSAAIAPNYSTTFTIAFTPTSSGSFEATVEIPNNDEDENPYTFTIKGKGLPSFPDIEILHGTTSILNNVGSYTFSNVLLGSSSNDETFTIKNVGYATLNLTGSSLVEIKGTDSSNFILNQTNTSSSINPNNSTTFKIMFKPNKLGLCLAIVSIVNNDPNKNPFTFTISGLAINANSGKSIGWIGGGSNGWKTSDGASASSDYRGFYYPCDVFIDGNGYIYVADRSCNRICKWDKNGISLGWIGGGTDGWKTSGYAIASGDFRSFDGPTGVFVDKEGYIYIADKGNFRISKWDSSGFAIGWIGGGSDGWKYYSAPTFGKNDYQSFDFPHDLCLDENGNIYVADLDNNRICKWDKNGNAIGWIGGGSDGWKTAMGSIQTKDYRGFNNPIDVSIDSSGNLYVADLVNYRVSKWSSSGTCFGWIGGGSDGWKKTDALTNSGSDFRSIATAFAVNIDSNDNIYISSGINRVCKWDNSGIAIGYIGYGSDGWQTGSGNTDYDNDYKSFNNPRGLFVDSSGYIYIADFMNHRICKWQD